MTARGALSVALFGVALVGCKAQESAFVDAEGDDVGLSAALELLLGESIRSAREAGASRALFSMAGAGIPGDSLGGLVHLPTEDCALVLARGAAGIQDLDVFAFADDGAVLGSDESSAKDASVLLCPPHPDRTFVSARLAAGFGLFGVSVQAVPQDVALVLGERFGMAPSAPAVARELESGWPGLDERLIEHRRRLGGTWESVRKVALPLDPRTYASVSTTLDANRCVDLLVTPSDEVAHLELEVMEQDGRWIGSGQAEGSDRSLVVCSPAQRELTVRCRPHAGRGLGALVISRSAPGGARELLQRSARFDLRPHGALSELRRALSKRLSDEGYGVPAFVREGTLPAERRISLALPLARGCSRIDVITAAPVESLGAWLWDAEGLLRAEDAGGSSATLFSCGPAASARLDLETLARGGAFSVELRHRATLPELAERHPLAASRLLRLLDARGLLASLSEMPSLQASNVSSTRLARLPLEIPAGSCLAVAAAVDGGASGLEVRLFEAAPAKSESVIDDGVLGYGTHAASARFCAVKPARDRIVTAELRANVGEGTTLWATRVYDPDRKAKAPRPR